MPWLWWAAAGAAAFYLGRVVARKKGPAKVLPATLLAIGAWPLSPLASGALLFYAAGDALLLNKDRFFLHGLAAFLVGHLLLVAALLQLGTRALSMGVLSVVGVLFVGVLAAVLPRVKGAVRVAIPLYAAALGAMVVTAATVSPLAACGAAIFALSDCLLAVNRFVRPLPAGEPAVSLTYQSALLALSGALFLTPPPN